MLAVEYERERTAAEMCRKEMEKVVGMVLTAGVGAGYEPVGPAATLQALWKGCPPLTEAPMLPPLDSARPQ